MPTSPPTFQRRQVGQVHDVSARREAERRAWNNAVYDSDWKKLRKRFLSANPVCSEDGCGARSVDVDHVLSVRSRPDLRLVWDNLRAFCHACHSRRTARDQAGWSRRIG